MAKPATITLAEAEALADEGDYWRREQQEAAAEARVEAHFTDVTTRQLTDMWATARNLDGALLSDFEFHALCAQWYIRHGVLPDQSEFGSRAPDDGQREPESPPPPVVIPERILSRHEVAEETDAARIALTSSRATSIGTGWHRYWKVSDAYTRLPSR